MASQNYDAMVLALDLRELTEKNLYVFKRLKERATRRQIAAEMRITVSGVNSHVRRVMQITDTHTVAAAMAVLVARGLV